VVSGVGLANIASGCTALTSVNLTDCLHLRDEDLRAFAWGSSEGVLKRFPDPIRDAAIVMRRLERSNAAAARAAAAKAALEGEDGDGDGAGTDSIGAVVVEDDDDPPDLVASLKRLILDGCFEIGDRGIKSATRRMRALRELSISVRPTHAQTSPLLLRCMTPLPPPATTSAPHHTAPHVCSSSGVPHRATPSFINASLYAGLEQDHQRRTRRYREALHGADRATCRRSTELREDGGHGDC
jgi:hypothetical protein